MTKPKFQINYNFQSSDIFWKLIFVNWKFSVYAKTR